MQSALNLATAHSPTNWNRLILSVTAEQRCRLLLTEGLQDSFTWRGTTVANPFAPPEHELINVLVDSQRH